jgi:hypothetical protein
MEGTSNIRKRFKVFETGILQAILLALILPLMSPLIESNYLLVTAQTSNTGANNTNSSLFSQAEEVVGTKPKLDSNNFKLEGSITSVTDGLQIEKGGIDSNQGESSSTNSSASHDSVLGGEWRIDVVRGNVEYFKSNMTVSRSDGLDMHDHEIEFRSDDPEVMLLPNNTAVITPNSGTVEIAALNLGPRSDKNITSISQANDTMLFSGLSDIITNGVIEWTDVPISVSILNGSTMNMKLDSDITDNHFSDAPIYGSVKSTEPINVIQNVTGH